MHRTTARFWASFARIPEPVQKVARENFELLKTNPHIALQEDRLVLVCQSWTQLSRPCRSRWS